MTTTPFSIVDVFSTTPYKGNPLAVVEDLSASLSDTQMKLITRQFNLSETTFVNPPTVPGAAYRLRSFLPDGKEIFGAGHNSLGALWWLTKHGYLDSISPDEGGKLRFKQQMGQEALPVIVSKPTPTGARGSGEEEGQELSVTLRQVAPQFYGEHPDSESLAATLGLDSPHSIGFEIAGQKIVAPQVVSTSTSRHLLVPIANEETLNRVALADRESLLREIQAADPQAYGLYLFTPGSQASHEGGANGTSLPTFVTRFFSPGMSGEDPATGSAAGPLAAYLHNRGILKVEPGEERDVKVLQGLQVGRACLLTVTVGQGRYDGFETSIKVTGGGVEVMSGKLAVPAVDVVF